MSVKNVLKLRVDESLKEGVLMSTESEKVYVCLQSFARENLSPKVSARIMEQAAAISETIDLWDLYNKTRLRYLVSKRARLIRLSEMAKHSWADYKKIFATPKETGGVGWLDKVLIRVDQVVLKYSDALSDDCQDKLWVDPANMKDFDRAVANLSAILRRLSCASCGSSKSGDHKLCYQCSLKEKVNKSWKFLLIKAESNVRLLMSGGKTYAQDLFDHDLDQDYRLMMKRVLEVKGGDYSNDDLRKLVEDIGKLSEKTDEMLAYNHWCDDGCGRPVFVRKGNDGQPWYPKLSPHCFGLRSKKKVVNESFQPEGWVDKDSVKSVGKRGKVKPGKKGKGNRSGLTVTDLENFYNKDKPGRGQDRQGKKRGGKKQHHID